MRIAIFSDNFYPELSGITDSVILLARELAKSGHKIDFYAPEYSAKNYRKAKLPVKEIDLGKNVTVNRLFSLPAPFSGGTARIVLPKLTGKLDLVARPDVIHSQLFFGTGLSALAAAKASGIPLIGTNHTAISEFVYFNHLKNISVKYAVWYYNRCDFVTAPSRSVIKEMLAAGFNRPWTVISNPLDLSNFSAIGAAEKKKFKKQFKLSENTIVCAGRLSPEKNLDVVFKAAALAKKRVPDLTLAVAGAGREEKNLKKLAVKLNLGRAVKFTGLLKQADLARLYQASEVYAIASTSETQSLTLMQSLATGLPAVAVNARALPEYVNGQNGYLVKSGDARAMADKFVLLLNDSARRQKLGRGALSFVRQFSAAGIAKKWEKIYLKVKENYRQAA